MDQRVIVYLRFREGKLIDTRQEIVQSRQMWSNDPFCLRWGFLTNDTFTLIDDGKIYRSWTLEWLEDRVLLHFVYPSGKKMEMVSPRVDDEHFWWTSTVLDNPIRLEKVRAQVLKHAEVMEEFEPETVSGAIVLFPVDDFQSTFIIKSDDGRWMKVHVSDLPDETMAEIRRLK